jgi:hypothetical protein
MARLSVRVLDTAAVQQRVLDTLRASRLRLWISNPTGCRLADAVTAASGSLVPEFVIADSEFGAFIPPFEAILTLDLISPIGRIELGRQRILIGGKSLKFRGPPVHLEDKHLFPQPGNYRLEAKVGQRNIVQFNFRFVSEAGLLRQVKVARIQIDAHTRAGESVPGVTTLRWEEHKGFQASLEIKSEMTAPRTLAVCTACIRDGSVVLQREEIAFPMDRVSRSIKLEPVQFGRSWLQARPRPARLTLEVTIGGEEKASAFVLVLPPERITNFEGQLSFDVKELPFDELEYSQIVQRLGLRDQAQPNRGFWQWLQTKLS